MAKYTSLAKSLSQSYRKEKIEKEAFERFRYNLSYLFDVIDEHESEDNTKSHLMSFFKNTFYFPDYLVAPKGKIDFVIHGGADAKAPVAILFEVKAPNSTREMVTVDDLNKKALQETLLYYLGERIDKKNIDLKYLIITNIYEYFIFDAQDFERLFYNNTKLKKSYEEFSNNQMVSSNTDFFYKEIAANYIEAVKDQLPYTYFDIRDYQKALKNESESRKLIDLFKVFSPIHLLKKVISSDSNSLNKNFYSELLHILGLEEISEGGKRIISRVSSKKNEASLIENTISILDSEDRLDVIRGSEYGDTRGEQLFNVALELCITWMNRILFLKLLEAQIVKYNHGNKRYCFLNYSKIANYDDLNKLFFQVLAKSYDERSDSVKNKWGNVPYLNSSLFEVSELESKTVRISNLSDSDGLPLFSGSVLKDKGKLRYPMLPTLRYLFEFLDAYDFASEGSEGVQEQPKTLINASVLGLIFEKINGHKDGSVFTPGVITMYMCHEAISQAIISKFNEKYGWKCQTITDLYNKDSDIAEANQLINSVKICDPAVGSGHFLVSALNEILRIKSELGILVDKNGKRLKDVSVTVENDELIVLDEESNLFVYNPQNSSSQRIQETLFREKQIIIENCLFGVDLNPNSVKICRLRLWIELLKNAYYKNETELETLPNIDINIKRGNSLIHKFKVEDSISDVLKQTNISISEYKKAVADYKSAPSKDQKHKILELIKQIKSTLKTEISNNDPKKKHLRVLNGKISSYEDQPELFELTAKQKKERQKELDQWKKEAGNIIKTIETIQNNKIYIDAFEWRIEFPEVLAENGDFMGFDCVIGNPPYMRVQSIRASNSEAADYYIDNYQSSTGSFDIYALFVESSFKLIRQNGVIFFIMPDKWTNSDFGKGLREITSKRVNRIISFGAYQVFDASTYTALQWFEKESTELKYIGIEQEIKNNVELGDWLNQIIPDKYVTFQTSNLSSEKWVLTSNIVKQILDKINMQPRRLSDVFEKIFQGIATSKDDVYFLYNAHEENNLVIGYSNQIEKEIILERGLVKPLLKGEDVHRYQIIDTDKYVIFPYKLVDGEATLYTEKELALLFPLGYAYLKQCESVLRDRENGRFNIDGCWFQYGRKQGITYAEMEKLVAPEISLGGNFSYDKNGDYYSTTKVYGYIKKETVKEGYLFWLGLLNSKLFWFYIQNTGYVLRGGYYTFKTNYINPYPVPNVIPEDIVKDIENSVKRIISMKNDLRDTSDDENAIDSYIYRLYSLSDDEIKLICSY